MIFRINQLLNGGILCGKQAILIRDQTLKQTSAKASFSFKTLKVLKNPMIDMLIGDDAYRHDPKCNAKLLLDTHLDVIDRQRSEEGEYT